MFKRILVATDGSTLSKKAVTRAIALAAQNDADLVALNVIPRYPRSYLEGSMTFSAEDIGRIEQQWAEKAQAMLDTVSARARESGVRIRTATANSDLVAESIIAAAKKYKSDLIVMASHGRKGIKRLLLGSETQHVLAHSTLPVLVLR
ncbi:universal stress protein [Variovorax gossypii]